MTPPNDLLDKVEQTWISRVHGQNIVPNGRPTQTYLRTEVEFFVGAMAALAALGYEMPPRWVITIMSGQAIVPLDQVKGHKQ